MRPILLLSGFAAQSLAEYPTRQTFDYVIVGAGPAGLLLANRLSEDPSLTVAVVEAGDAQYDNPNVTRVDTFSPGLGTQIDWNYISAPQKYANGNTQVYTSGKALGGTTTINGMTYLRAEKEQIDQWEVFGNEGWNWDSLYEYYRSQEQFQPSDAEKADHGANYEESFHGFAGELAVGWSQYFMKDGVFELVKETSENLGIKWNKDANGGRMSGFSTWPFTLNSTTNTREDAARAFYYPIAEERSNLHVFLNMTATKIVWKEEIGNSGHVVAAGVAVISSANATETLYASGEVILSAGSLRSPALLEHSGVGNPSVLSPLNIETVVDLPSVGANFQDQPWGMVSFSSPANWSGYPSFVSYLTASDLFGSELEAVTEEIRANISAYAAQIVVDAPPNSTTMDIEERLINLQLDLVFSKDSTVPLAEILPFPAPGSFTFVFWTLLPFSRGSIHINTRDATVPPSIDPNFFQLPIDTLIQAALFVKVREYYATAPLSDHVTAEVIPNTTSVPANAGFRDPSWETWIKEMYTPNHHPIASCAMRSREWGGVVDKEGRVHGVENVRVVDAGVMPTQLSGHLSASVYAIAGKIADGMKQKVRARRSA